MSGKWSRPFNVSNMDSATCFLCKLVCSFSPPVSCFWICPYFWNTACVWRQQQQQWCQFIYLLDDLWTHRLCLLDDGRHPSTCHLILSMMRIRTSPSFTLFYLPSFPFFSLLFFKISSLLNDLKNKCKFKTNSIKEIKKAVNPSVLLFWSLFRFLLITFF